MKNKKIMFFICERDFGTGTMLVQQAIAFNQIKEFDFLFVAGGTEKEEGLFNDLTANKISFVKIDGLEFHKKFWNLVHVLSTLIKEYNPQVVHVQTNWQLAIVIFAKLLALGKYKIFYTVHGFRNNNRIKSIIFRIVISVFFFLFVSRIIVCSSYVKKKFKILNSKLRLLFLGVDNIYLQKDNNNDLPITDNIKIIYPAAFRSGKKQELLIKVIAKIQEKSEGHSDVSLILPGNGENKKKCIQLASILGVESKVHFPGFLNKNELLDELSTCSIAIIPSISETFGHCIAEPFAFGRCVISRNVGVAPDIIKNGQNGYIFKSDSELINVINLLLENNHLIIASANNAFNMRNIFDWVYIGEKYKLIVQESFKK